MDGYYHVMSRTAGAAHLFGKLEKEQLRRMMRQVAQFSGIELLTYAVMSNHFHALVRVPGEREVPDAELVRRFRILYPRPTRWQPMDADSLGKELESDTTAGRLLRRSLTLRMNDVSWFARTLKQRFSIWFNHMHDRKGTLWSERFRSVLVEGKDHALRTVAAYIDLNAVRAGLVDDPKDYRFCGYGEAVGGSQVAREGLAAVDPSLEGYRMTLFGVGSEPRAGQRYLSREKAARVMEAGGNLSLPEALRCRVRYFSQGRIIGCRAFVSAQAPPASARPAAMEGADWDGLATLGGIRKAPFG